jgi:hypothetical protein
MGQGAGGIAYSADDIVRRQDVVVKDAELKWFILQQTVICYVTLELHPSARARAHKHTHTCTHTCTRTYTYAQTHTVNAKNTTRKHSGARGKSDYVEQLGFDKENWARDKPAHSIRG